MISFCLLRLVLGVLWHEEILHVQTDIRIVSKSLIGYVTLPADLPPDCTFLKLLCHCHIFLPFPNKNPSAYFSFLPQMFKNFLLQLIIWKQASIQGFPTNPLQFSITSIFPMNKLQFSTMSQKKILIQKISMLQSSWWNKTLFAYLSSCTIDCLTTYLTLPTDLPPGCISLIACMIDVYVWHFHTKIVSLSKVLSFSFCYRYWETFYSQWSSGNQQAFAWRLSNQSFTSKITYINFLHDVKCKMLG